MAGWRGSFAFDDEGTPAQRTVLVEKGVLKTYMYDRLTAAKEEGEEMTAPGGEKIELGIPEQMRAMASAIIPLGRPATPQEASGPVLFLASPLANYVHGQVLNVTGGQFGGMTT